MKKIIYGIIDWANKNNDVMFVIKIWIVCTIVYIFFKNYT